MAERHEGLETPRDIINRTIHKIGPAAEQKYFAHAILMHWGDIAGKYIARNTDPQGIRREVLYLYCPNPALRNELKMLEPRIVQKVNNYAGCAMIKEIAFTRRWESPDSEGIAELLAADQVTAVNIPRELKKISLTEAEIARAKFAASSIEDQKLADKCQLLYQKSLQLRHLRESLGYVPCKGCGALIEPGDDYCYSCYRERHADLLTAIRRVLQDIPWARIGEVRRYVKECTPHLLNHERAAMVNVLCGRVMVGDTESIDAKTLVMLYRCLPPEQLTDDVMTRTIYELRYALVKPPNYQAPKRYDVIKLGKRERSKK